MSANDTDEAIHRETDWIAVPLAENKPFLGICLGAQMLARHLGARVAPHPNGMAEVGYYPIRPTAIGRAVVPVWPSHVYQWHREGFDLPAGAELLAEGDMFPVQAFRLGAAYAIQFHGESHPSDDVPLDRPRPRTHPNAGRQASSRGAFC